MNDENEILEFLNKNGLRYLSKFETTEAQFKSFLKKKIDVLKPNLSTFKKNEFIHLITEKMKKYDVLKDCLQKARHFSIMARDSLGTFADNEEKQKLIDLISFLINRKK